MEFSDCVFDCVFGTGFTGEIKGNIARIVSAMNDTRAIKIAVDMPSGVCATTGKASQVCIRADYTITLGAPKIGLFLLPGKKFAGEVWLADIGIPEVSFADAQPDCFLVSSQMVRSLLPARPAEMHKGVGGNLLLLAGSVQYSGAPVVASYGALRSGAGIVTLGLPDALNGKMYFQLLPETILRFFPSQEGCFSLQKEIINEFNSTYRAILAGSGWGRSAELKKTLEVLLSNWKGRLVLDADALNLLEDPQKLGELEFIPVVTPHLGEMARLTRKSIAEIQDNSISCARDFARKYQTVVVLKSAVTLIASPDGRMFVSSRPNTGLARGGSGDLLAGFITGLLATGMPPLDAAIAGVHIMADAGELAVEELGEDSVTVSEVASYIPRAFLRLRRGKVEQEQP
jgi:NAD(P)H-hydrate epimerase